MSEEVELATSSSRYAPLLLPLSKLVMDTVTCVAGFDATVPPYPGDVLAEAGAGAEDGAGTEAEV